MASSDVRWSSGVDEALPRGAVDWPTQPVSPVVGEVAGNPGTTNGDEIMKGMNRMTRNEEGPALRELETSELTEITGGTIWVGDGYCVSPWHPPLPLPLLAVTVQQPALAKGP